MEPDEQLEWEQRAGRPAGIAAIVASILLFGGNLIYPAVTADDQSNSAAEALQRVHDTPAYAYVPGVLQVIGYFAMVVPLYYLYRATKARRDELLGITRYMAVAGPVLTAAAFMTHQIVVVKAANDFVAEHLPMSAPAGAGAAAGDGGPLGALAGVLWVAEDRAADLLRDESGTPVLVALQYLGILSVGFAFVLLGMNAMRAGLLSRFMGYLAIAIGVFTVIAIFGPIGVIVQIFWLGALGLLLLDRWPNGRGPAWETVEAIPWPSAMDQRAALAGEQEDEEEDEEDFEPDEDEPEDDEPEDDGPAPTPHPTSRKRKRKRRR